MKNVHVKFFLVILGLFAFLNSSTTSAASSLSSAERARKREEQTRKMDAEEQTRKKFIAPAIFDLINNQKFNEAKKLIDADLDVLTHKDFYGYMPLLRIISFAGYSLEADKSLRKINLFYKKQGKYQDFLKTLLKKPYIGRFINMPDRDNYTPLCRVARIIKGKSNPLNHYEHPNEHPIALADPAVEMKGHKKLVRKLLKVGADASLCSPEDSKAIEEEIKEHSLIQQQDVPRTLINQFLLDQIGEQIATEKSVSNNEAIHAPTLLPGPAQPATGMQEGLSELEQVD